MLDHNWQWTNIYFNESCIIGECLASRLNHCPLLHTDSTTEPETLKDEELGLWRARSGQVLHMSGNECQSVCVLEAELQSSRTTFTADLPNTWYLLVKLLSSFSNMILSFIFNCHLIGLEISAALARLPVNPPPCLIVMTDSEMKSELIWVVDTLLNPYDIRCRLYI